MKKLLILLFSIFFLISTSVFADYELDFSLTKFCAKAPNVQNRDGVLYFPNKKVGISAKSLCIYKDAYGQYESKGELKEGKFHGKWIYWHKNGQKWGEANYQDGKENGKFTSWDENGQILIEMHYKDGKCISGDC